MTRPLSPLPLKIVAALFIVGGVSSAIEVIVDLTRNHVNINFGVLGIFVGLGLLRHSANWRTLGLVFLWLSMIVGPIALIAVLGAPQQADLKLFGVKVGKISTSVFFLFGAAFYALIVWQYRVLTRPGIRALFYPPAHST